MKTEDFLGPVMGPDGQPLKGLVFFGKALMDVECYRSVPREQELAVRAITGHIAPDDARQMARSEDLEHSGVIFPETGLPAMLCYVLEQAGSLPSRGCKCLGLPRAVLPDDL